MKNSYRLSFYPSFFIFHSPLYIVGALLLSSLLSCIDMVPTEEVRLIDPLDGKMYAYRHRNLSSSYKHVYKAYRQVNLYRSGKVEASDGLGFCALMDMDFDRAEAYHKEVYRPVKNEFELLAADIGLMKIRQRTVLSKESYDYRNSILRWIKRICEGSDLFANRHETLRLDHTFTESFLVSSIYYYHLQQRQEAMTSIDNIQKDEASSDTNQLLYYHYFRGSVSLVTASTPEERKLRESNGLYLTQRTAVKGKYPYFKGNGMQGLASLMAAPPNFEFFKTRCTHALDQFDFLADSLFPLRLIQLALKKFREYNGLHQITGAYVSIGKCLNVHGRHQEALDTLLGTLNCVNHHHMLYHHNEVDTPDKLYTFVERDTIYTGVPRIGQEKVKTVPEQISRIGERLGVSYVRLGIKDAFDYSWNIYPDILNFTCQDKELESRKLSLETGSRQVTLVLFLIIVGLILIITLWWSFNKCSKVRNRMDVECLQRIFSLYRDIASSIPMNIPLIQQSIDQLPGKERLTLKIPEEGETTLVSPSHRLDRNEKALIHVLEPYTVQAIGNEQMVVTLSDERVQLERQWYIHERHITGNKCQNLIEKACMTIVSGIDSYIDRILNEVHKLTEKGYIDDAKTKKEEYQYIDELVTTIDEYDDILALWIKMKQGMLSLNTEAFSSSGLFDLSGKGQRAFEVKKQELKIESTTLMAEADHALTSFMANTLAKNAYKYTPGGGMVKVYVHAIDAYVEIFVENNERGLSAEDITRIIGEKVHDSHAIGMKDAANPEELKKNKGSGFGLVNCKGIIEKYKKTNGLFQVCVFDIGNKSRKRSRLYLRLPSEARRVIGVLFCLLLFVGFGSYLQTPTSPIL